MKDLIDSAVASAARSGIQAAVILVGPNAGEASGQTTGDSEALREHLTQATQQRDSALRQNEQLSQQLREAQSQIAQLRAQPEQSAPASAEQPTEVIDYDGMQIGQLNLPEKVAKVCEKEGIEFIGQLREFYPKLGDHRVNQKDRIAVAEALMGYVSSHGTGAAPAPSGGTPGGSATPTGHTDRAWPERLKVARTKEQKDKHIRGKLDSALPGLQTAIPDLPAVTDSQFHVKALAALVADTVQDKHEAAQQLGKYLAEREVQQITHAQTLAMLYSLGFDPKDHREVDPALQAAGLVQFMEDVPAEATEAAA